MREADARWPVLRACLLALCLLCAGAAQAAGALLTLTTPGSIDVASHAQLFDATNGDFPTPAQRPGWLDRQLPAARVHLLGGAYWLALELRNDSAETNWVFAPSDTLIEQVTARLDGSDGSVQQLHSGYLASHQYMLHDGRDITLRQGVRYQLLVYFSSPYYARKPVFALVPQRTYQQTVNRETFLIIGSLGALTALALFNFFLFSFTRERASLYYSLYVLTYALAWAMTLQVMADLFGWHQLSMHYVPFFLLPVLSTLFYTHFLRLATLAPRLARISRINLVLPLLLLPSCFFALRYAHTLATIAIAIWMTLALISGIVVWRRGYQPARFFVLAFVALMVPGLVILPANLGLMPSLVDNPELFTLLGGTLDGILLAFALADQIRLLRDKLELRVAERTLALTQSNDALTLAKEHAEVVSRHRIDFLSAMSHDIRTPLAGVIGMLKFALRDLSVRGRTQEYLRIGLHNGESLLTILNDILDFSKIDAGKLTLEQVDFDLGRLVEDAVQVLQGQADAKSLLLSYTRAPELPPFVRGDPSRIRQILINLLGNAIKFTERGEVCVAVRTEASFAGGVLVGFSVHDSGPGIAPDIAQRLFQKFEQADHSTTRRYGGTGLGLAICKQLVDLMGGTIGVDSAPGQGARFAFELPLALGTAPPAPPYRAPHERHSHQLRVLCAEDVRTNQIIIGTLLEQMGHTVRIVENGVEALAALAADDFDLVLMDGRMPRMDGEQATLLIRAGGQPGAAVRDPQVSIIALTANASALDCTRYLAAGMTGFLSKPVDERSLYEQIASVIAELLARGHSLRASAAAPDQPALPDVERALARQFGVAQAPHPAPPALFIVPLPGLSSTHMARITQAFLDEAPRRVALAVRALADGDAAGAASAFHALKGSTAYLSSAQPRELAQQLETLVEAGQLAEAAAGLGALEQAIELACRDLRAGQAGARTAPA